VTPEGIVGKVSAVYPLVAQVLLVTDSTFKVGVESQKGHVHGVLDCGTGKCVIEQIQNEDRVDVGEWFFTSGEDRIFPRGFPVGSVISTQPGQGMKDVKLNLSGAPGGVEQVLVVLQGVHKPIPVTPVLVQTTERLLPPPMPEGTAGAQQAVKPQTEADKIFQKYDQIGKEQGHVYGGYGSSLPNFNAKPGAGPKQTPASDGKSAPATAATPPTAATPKSSAPAGPAILGSRPAGQPNTTAPPPQPSAQRDLESDGPVLPLGAPRRKPSATPETPPQTTNDRSKQ
jgi:rod shape-determining protein MreC